MGASARSGYDPGQAGRCSESSVEGTALIPANMVMSILSFTVGTERLAPAIASRMPAVVGGEFSAGYPYVGG